MAVGKHAWQGAMCRGGMHGRGHTGVECKAAGVCGMGGACVAGGMHVGDGGMHGREACMAGEHA